MLWLSAGLPPFGQQLFAEFLQVTVPPTAILPLPDIALTVSPLLSHVHFLLCSNTQYQQILRIAGGKEQGYQNSNNFRKGSLLFVLRRIF